MNRLAGSVKTGEQQHLRSIQDTQLMQLEHLIAQQRKAHSRMRHVLREAEKVSYFYIFFYVIYFFQILFIYFYFIYFTFYFYHFVSGIYVSVIFGKDSLYLYPLYLTHIHSPTIYHLVIWHAGGCEPLERLFGNRFFTE